MTSKKKQSTEAAVREIRRRTRRKFCRRTIQSGKAQGMQLMDDALFALVKEKRILPMDAYRKALDKSRFESLVGEPAQPAA
jgi:twitching motility protein PilT